jgi:hypothetical protein
MQRSRAMVWPRPWCGSGLVLSVVTLMACAAGEPPAQPVDAGASIDARAATSACIQDNALCAMASDCCYYGTCVAGARSGVSGCAPQDTGECVDATGCDAGECCHYGVCVPGTAPTPTICAPQH